MFPKIASALALSVAPAAAAVAQAPALGPVYARILAAHNQQRLLVGSAPLRWDPALASAAASYGPTLARIGHLQHSPKAARPGQRENLWMGTHGYFSPEQMVGTWTAEKRYFRPGVYPAVSTTGNWIDVSHYTAMVWPTTTHVGCAIYSTAAVDYLICRYSPPGNIDGRPLRFNAR